MAMVTAMVTATATDMERSKGLTIAVDFDGTIVEHEYPKIGREKPFAVETLLSLQEEGHTLILWTARDGELLEDAINWCASRGLRFYAVNSNHPKGYLFQGRSDKSCKVIADIYIDDHNLGGLPDWDTIYTLLSGLRQKKRSWWKRTFRKRSRRR